MVVCFDWFYHSEKLQSTKTSSINYWGTHMFYHSEKLQSTKTKFKHHGYR